MRFTRSYEVPGPLGLSESWGAGGREPGPGLGSGHQWVPRRTPSPRSGACSKPTSFSSPSYFGCRRAESPFRERGRRRVPVFRPALPRVPLFSRRFAPSPRPKPTSFSSPSFFGRRCAESLFLARRTGGLGAFAQERVGPTGGLGAAAAPKRGTRRGAWAAARPRKGLGAAAAPKRGLGAGRGLNAARAGDAPSQTRGLNPRRAGGAADAHPRKLTPPPQAPPGMPPQAPLQAHHAQKSPGPHLSDPGLWGVPQRRSRATR